MNYLEEAKKIIKKHNLDNYVEILLNYWSQFPPTLGHGFAHVLKVAIEAYILAIDNSYDHPEYLFVGGLFHDIYRPAEGRDGEEDQYLSLKITIELFYKNNIPADISTKVLHAIESHDNWRGKENVPEFDLLLSTADKMIIADAAYPYAWASNQYSISKIGKPIYNNFIQFIYGFVKYQQRAWEVFMKHPVNGTQKAIHAYISIYNSFCENYLKDPEGKNFQEFIEKQAKEFAKTEKEYLLKFTNQQIAKLITQNYPY